MLRSKDTLDWLRDEEYGPDPEPYSEPAFSGPVEPVQMSEPEMWELLNSIPMEELLAPAPRHAGRRAALTRVSAASWKIANMADCALGIAYREKLA